MTDYESLVAKAIDGDVLIEELDRKARLSVLREEVAAGKHSLKEGERVCLRETPWKRGRINTVGHGVFEVYFDDGFITAVDGDKLKRTSR